MPRLYHGFYEKRSSPLPELNATLHELEHQNTGAGLVWLERAEENKTFGIAFSTLPWDDTGVFHILEHSVLCGSEKYPVKEPFVELLKHSMNTFLNALTFPDKTLYPISSRNSKDFFTLMRVYLDAVLRPSIYDRPEIFRQEGWHYAFDDQGRPSYQGVVLNEMKGMFADADILEQNALNRALFPDSPYRYVSGGDPASIPDLTYEKFVETHRRFYAPSNALIFLDGAVDLGAALKILDEEYLAQFQATRKTKFPTPQLPVDGGVQTVRYEVASQEEEEGHTRVAWGMVLGSYAQRETILTAQILAEALCGDNEAPLCKAVLSRRLAQGVAMEVVDGVAQPWMRLEIRDLKLEQAPQVEQCVFDELTRLAEQGIDRNKLEAVLARQEFQLREQDFGGYPSGIVLCMRVLESWLYGGHPEQNLQVGDLFDRLRAKMKEGYFEQMLRRLMLDNPHRCKVVLQPDHLAGAARRAREAERLSRESAGWSESCRAALIEQQKKLECWQQTPDTPERLATLPCLTLADVPDRPEELPLEKTTLSGLPVLLHRVDTAGIVYLTLYFDADDLGGKQLSQLNFLTRLLGHMPTRNHSAEDLNDRIRLLCGDLQFYTNVYTGRGCDKKCQVKLCVSMSALKQKLPQAMDLLAEILTQTKLEDGETALDLLRQGRMQQMQNCIMSGHALGLGRLLAQFSAAGVAQEHLTGFSDYQWMKQCEENWDWDLQRAALSQLLARVLVKSRLTVSVTADDPPTEQITKPLASALLDGVPALKTTSVTVWGRRREGIVIPADIAFSCCGGNFLAAGTDYSGAWQLVSKLVGLEYLWQTVRVQGGAYGAGLIIQDNGLAACYSYRDPHGRKSLETYRNCASFLREYCQKNRDLTGLIIGAVSDSEPLLTPRSKGMTADVYYWKGLRYSDRCQRRQELMRATPETLLSLADTLEAALQGGVCVVGGQAQLEHCQLDCMEHI